LKETEVAESQKNAWQRVWFRTNKVWAAIDDKGGFVEENGKVPIRYQKNQDYEYWVRKESLRPIEAGPGKDHKNAARKKSGRRSQSTAAQPDSASSDSPEGAIAIYTDGASSGNPGPAGIGVLLRFESHEREISKSIGRATNNIAELLAIKTGLLAVKRRDIPVRIYTDSSYALGVLTKGWKARKNTDLVQEIRKILSGFRNVKVMKVRGHAGQEGNERADKLATDAAARNS